MRKVLAHGNKMQKKSQTTTGAFCATIQAPKLKIHFKF